MLIRAPFPLLPAAGMPIHGTGGMRHGDLYIKFNVVLPPPGALDGKALALLRSILPRSMDKKYLVANKRKEDGEDRGGEASSVGDDVEMSSSPKADAAAATDYLDVSAGSIPPDAHVEDVSLGDVSVELRRARVQAQAEAARHSSSSEAYDSDDDEGRGPQRVQCAQQ